MNLSPDRLVFSAWSDHLQLPKEPNSSNFKHHPAGAIRGPTAARRVRRLRRLRRDAFAVHLARQRICPAAGASVVIPRCQSASFFTQRFLCEVALMKPTMRLHATLAFRSRVNGDK